MKQNNARFWYKKRKYFHEKSVFFTMLWTDYKKEVFVWTKDYLTNHQTFLRRRDSM